MSLLLSPCALGALHLRNRVVMAPLTRCRVTNEDAAPDALVARYYAQRATAGLIISEGAIVSPQARGYPYTPGIWSSAQIDGWRLTTDAVHEKGGVMVCQLWHCGRLSLPDFHAGLPPVGPSAVDPQMTMISPEGPKPTVTPRALSKDDIRRIVGDFRQAAANAVSAGFDGVEIHASNGYLFHQFFARCSNRRDDEYGGSHENRGRLLFEVLDAVGAVMPMNRVGLRLNPMMNGIHGISIDEDTLPMFEYIAARTCDYDLAYIHLTEPFLPGQIDGIEHAVPEVARHFRPLVDAPLISNGAFDRDKAEAMIGAGLCDAVAFGRPYIANPDLVERFRTGAALAQPDQDTFYQGGERGYTDYPAATGQPGSGAAADATT